MDPITQTLLTIGCMFGAFIWGKLSGFSRGALWAFDRVLEELQADGYEIDQERDTLKFYKKGKEFSARGAWLRDEDVK